MANSNDLSQHAPPPAGAPPPPPAGAPPPPPTTVTQQPPQQQEGGAESQPLLSDGTSSSAASQQFQPPTITHYYNSSVGGNASLSPNTGEANAFQEEVMGLALSEIVFKLQWSCVLSCFFVFLWKGVITIWVLPIQLLTLNISFIILTFYLIFFAFVLLLLEIYFTGSMLYSYPIVPNNYIYKLIDNFGFLFHPLKKACFVFILAFHSLILSRGSTIIEYALGIWWIGNSICTIYVWSRYPDFRKHTHKLRVAARQQVAGAIPTEKRQHSWRSWSDVKAIYNTFGGPNTTTAPTSANV